jgi:hypothetical protein
MCWYAIDTFVAIGTPPSLFKLMSTAGTALAARVFLASSLQSAPNL